jgi:iron complex outermembrane recepter protein
MSKLGKFLSTTAGVAVALCWSVAVLAQTGQAEQPGSGAATPSPSGSANTEQETSNTAATAADGAATGVGETGLEEIVVTAQRRAQNLQEVPIAVSAFSAAELENRGVTETLDLIQYVPNLFGSNNTGLGSANAYYLRGLGNTETIATFDPPVGTYIDDVYISRQNANNFSFFDVERVEVLRGPQGTLFGRNTTGGAVNLILKKPGDELAGFAEVGYGRFDKYLARGSIDVPFGEGFAIKLSGYYQDDKGYVKNVTTGDRLNDSDGAGLRLAARFDLSEGVSWNVAAAYIRNDGENLLNFQCNPANTSDCNGRFITTGLRENVDGASQFAPLVISGRKANFDLENEADSLLITSNLQFEGENHTLNLITGVLDLTQKFALDFFDGRGGPNVAVPNPPVRGFVRGGFTILNDAEHKQFTQEVKLTGELFGGFVDYVAGAYFYDEGNRTDFADVFTLGIVPGPNGFPLLLADRVLDNDTNALAGYAQADFNVTDQLTLTAGIRYTDEEKTIELVDNRATCLATPLPDTCLDNRNLRAANGATIPTELNTDLWTPRFAVNFEPNDDLLFFASATRGFKSGGWNARATAPGQFLPFGPEKVWNYEGGFKSDLWDNRLRFNVTAFYLDVADLQTPSAFVAPNGSITFITRNFADYENKGVEVELNAIPLDGLNLYLNAGFQDDKYKIDRGAPALDEFGIQSVAAQQAACLAQRAAGQIPGTPNTAPAGTPVNNAPACAAGIIGPNGEIAEPVRTPDFTLAAGGTYDLPIESAGIIVSPSINVVYRSKIETGTSNLSFYNQPVTGSNGAFPTNPFGNGAYIGGSESKAHTLINASLALRTDDDNWLLAIECENCFGETFTQSTLANYTYINPPATWMIRARRKF